jgi:hypothetical protein
MDVKARSCKATVDGYRRAFAHHFHLQSSREVRVVHALIARGQGTLDALEGLQCYNSRQNRLNYRGCTWIITKRRKSVSRCMTGIGAHATALTTRRICSRRLPVGLATRVSIETNAFA